MNDINQVCFSGCLGKDAFVKSTTDNQGQPATVFGFSIAVNKGKKDQYGNWTDVPSWIDCVYYTRLQNIALTKGEKVIVWGSMEQKTTVDQTGLEVKRLRVMVDRLEKIQLSGQAKPRQNQGNNYQAQNQYSQPQQVRQAQPTQRPQQSQLRVNNSMQSFQQDFEMDGGDNIPF